MMNKRRWNMERCSLAVASPSTREEFAASGSEGVAAKARQSSAAAAAAAGTSSPASYFLNAAGKTPRQRKGAAGKRAAAAAAAPPTPAAAPELKPKRRAAAETPPRPRYTVAADLFGDRADDPPPPPPPADARNSKPPPSPPPPQQQQRPPSATAPPAAKRPRVSEGSNFAVPVAVPQPPPLPRAPSPPAARTSFGSARRTFYTGRTSGGGLSQSFHSSPGAGSSPGGASATGSPGLFDPSPPRLGGFANIGNTCYMSAVLSAVLRLRLFSDAVLSTNRIYALAGETEGVLPFLAESVKGIHSGGAMGIRPDRLKEAVAEQHTAFEGNQQQDAHEFLLSFLNLLHEEVLGTLLKVKAKRQAAADKTEKKSGGGGVVVATAAAAEQGRSKRCIPEGVIGGVSQDFASLDSSDEEEVAGSPLPSADGDGGGEAAPAAGDGDGDGGGAKVQRADVLAAEAADRALPSDESPSLVRRLMEGQLQQEYVCQGCGTRTRNSNAEVFSVFTLPVKAGLSVQDIVLGTLHEEVITRDCPRKGKRGAAGCSAPDTATARTLVKALPQYLVLHMNRFSCGVDEYGLGVPTVRKNSSAVGVSACLTLKGHVAETDDGLDLPPSDAVSFTDDGDLRCRRPVAPGGAAAAAAEAEAEAGNLEAGDPCGYGLRSVVHHLGATAGHGHYVADFLDERGRWQRADDSCVRSTSAPTAAASSTCYLLIYERLSAESNTGLEKNVAS